MNSNILHEKIALILSFLILNNYLILSLNFPLLLIKINFIFFIITTLIFYFRNLSENIFLKIFFLFILFICLGTPIIDWDPRSIYFFHAKRIFYDQSIYSVIDNYASFSHNDYQSLAPAFASSLAVLVGEWNEVFPKLAFTLMFLPPLILAYTFFNNTRYLIFLSIVFYTIGKFLFNGWVDGLVAIYFGLSSFLMYLLVVTENNFYKKRFHFYLLAFCFFITLTLIKNEGIALLFTLFTATTLIKIFKSEFKKEIIKLSLLSLSFLPIIAWKLFCYSKGIGNDYINNDFFSNLLPRLIDVNNYKLVSYFILLNEKFIIVVIFFLVSFWIKANKRLFVFVSSISLIYIFILFIIFLSTPFDLYFQLDSTAARVIRSLNFFLAIFSLYNLKNYKLN